MTKSTRTAIVERSMLLSTVRVAAGMDAVRQQQGRGQAYQRALPSLSRPHGRQQQPGTIFAVRPRTLTQRSQVLLNESSAVAKAAGDDPRRVQAGRPAVTWSCGTYAAASKPSSVSSAFTAMTQCPKPEALA